MDKQKLKIKYHEQMATIEMAVKEAKELAKKQKKKAKADLEAALTKSNALKTIDNNNLASEEDASIKTHSEMQVSKLTLIKPSQFRKWKAQINGKPLKTIPQKLAFDLQDNISTFEMFKKDNLLCSIDDFLPYVNFLADSSVTLDQLQLIIASSLKWLSKNKIIILRKGILKQIKSGSYNFLVYQENSVLHDYKKGARFVDDNFRKVLLRVLRNKLNKGSKILITPHIALMQKNKKIVVLNGLGSLK